MLEYIKENKHWIFSGIGIFIISLIISVIVYFFPPKYQSQKDNANIILKTGPDAFQKIKIQSPLYIPDEQHRQQVRQAHDVKQLQITENELKFSAAPRGVFGFAQPRGIHDYDSLRLNRIFSKTIHFEFHKMMNGQGEIIGFASPDVVTMVRRDDRRRGFRATIYNRMWLNAPSIVSIPLNSLSENFEQRTITLDNHEHILALDVEFK